MPSNVYAGMVVGFAGEDQGLESAFDRTAENLEEMNEMLEEQSEISKKSFLPKLMKRLTQFSIGNMANQMSSLAGDSNRLTNNIEAFGVQASATVKPMLAEMGMFGKEASKVIGKISGIAYATNLDAGTITGSFKALHEASSGAKDALDEFDLSLKDHAKIEAVTGMNTQNLVNILGDLTDSWGMSAKGSKELVDQMVALGQESGLGAQGLATMGENLEAIDVAFAKSQIPKTPEMIAGINTSLVKLGGAFREGLGVGPEEAMQQARGVFAAFAQEVQTAEEAVSKGLAPTYGELTTALAEVYGSEEKALAALERGTKDPLALMAELNEQFAKMSAADPTYFGRLQSRLADIAPNMAFLVTNTDKGTKALSDMSNMTVKAEGAFKRLREGHSAGITLAESLERSKEAFETTIRSIARADVRGFVAKQRKAYAEVGKEWKAAAKEGGVFGKTIEYISSFDQLGIQGIFSQIGKDLGFNTKGAQKFGIQTGYLVDKANQLAGEFQPIVSMMSMLGPFGTLGVAGGIAAWFTLDSADQKNVLGSWYEPIKGAMDKVEDIWKKWAPKIIGMWNNKIWPAVSDGWNKKVVPALTKFWHESFVPMLKENAPKIGAAIWDALKWAWEQVTENLGVGGSIALGAAVAGAVGGGGLLGAANNMVSMITTAFGSSGVIGVAAGALFAGIFAETKWALSEIRKEREKTAAFARGKIQKGGAEIAGVHAQKISQRRQMFGEMTTEEIGAGLAGGVIEGSKLEQFTKQAKDYANTIRKMSDVEEEFAKRYAQKYAVDIDSAGVQQAFAGLTKTIEMVQKLPELQAELGRITGKGTAGGVATGLLNLQAAYSPEKIKELIALRTEFEAQQAKVASAMTRYEAGEFDVFGTQGMTTEQESMLQGVSEKYSNAIMDVAGIAEQAMLDTEGKAYESGANVLGEMAGGITDAEPVLKQGLDDSLNSAVVNQIKGNSPPLEGPLSGDTLPGAGANILSTMIDGMYEYSPIFKEDMAAILTDAVTFAVEVFHERAISEIDKKTTFLNEKLKALMETEVYKKFITDVTIAGGDKEAKKAAREVSVTGLSDSGLLGVKRAIAVQTGMVVKVLNRIERNTRPIKEKKSRRVTA